MTTPPAQRHLRDHVRSRAIARATGPDDRQLVIYRLGDAHRLRLPLATVRQTVTSPAAH
jgi:hypothetical protein